MSQLVVQHLHSRFRATQPLDRARCHAWLQAFSAQDDAELAAGLAGDDDWLLIRRLPLALRWAADASEADVGLQWNQALRRALQQAADRAGSDDVLRYPQRHDAVADLLYRSALGEPRRQWAWHRMGLVAQAEAAPAEVLQQGVALLLREPELAWPVLHRLVRAEPATAALTALLRALPAPAWQQLLRACPRTAPYAGAVAGPEATEAAPAASPVPAEGVAPTTAGAEMAVPAGSDAQALLAWAGARPQLAARHADTLAVLIAALAWPATGAPGRAQQARRAAMQRRLAAFAGPATRPTPPATPAVPHGAAGPTAPATRTAAATPAPALPPADATDAPATLPNTRDDSLPALPALPEAGTWHGTHWGGALFWLARIPASGVLDALARRRDAPPQALLLKAIAQALGVPPDDPAAAAFCGGELPTEAPPPALADQAATLVAQWSAWLDEAAPDLPAPRLAAVCRRSGRLRFEAGWIELHLPLHGVDVAVRRLGLDLDPGWLPWLGCVVRIRYDE